jgi:hypothetical protein
MRRLGWPAHCFFQEHLINTGGKNPPRPHSRPRPRNLQKREDEDEEENEDEGDKRELCSNNFLYKNRPPPWQPCSIQ